MVTSNNVGPFNRFKISTVMGDSYVERYIRARKRHTASPKSLFGVPSQSEIDQYLLEHNTEEMANSQEKLKKYDLANIGNNLLEEAETSISDNCTTSFSNNARESLRFQPTIITENNPPPAKNLFSPIDKIEIAVGASSKNTQIENTEYWQTSKRRRSSEENKTEETTCKSPRVDNDSSEPTADNPSC